MEADGSKTKPEEHGLKSKTPEADSSSIKMNGDKSRVTLELGTTMTAGYGVKRRTLAEMSSEGCSCARRVSGSKSWSAV